MKRRKLLQALGRGWLLLSLSAVSMNGMAAGLQSIPEITETPIGWQLTQAVVLNPGIETISPQGELIDRYRVEATAGALEPAAPIKKRHIHHRVERILKTGGRGPGPVTDQECRDAQDAKRDIPVPLSPSLVTTAY